MIGENFPEQLGVCGAKFHRTPKHDLFIVYTLEMNHFAAMNSHLLTILQGNLKLPKDFEAQKESRPISAETPFNQSSNSAHGSPSLRFQNYHTTHAPSHNSDKRHLQTLPRSYRRGSRWGSNSRRGRGRYRERRYHERSRQRYVRRIPD